MKGEKEKERKVATLEKFQSQQKIENTPVTTAEATNGDSLSPVAGAEPVIDAWKKMENKPVTVVEVSDDSSFANKDCPAIRKEKKESRRVIAAKATRDYSQGKMESNPVTTAKSTSADFSSPSPVDIFDGNSSPQKIENTPVTSTVEANNGDSLSPVERPQRKWKATATACSARSPSFIRPNGVSASDTIEFNLSAAPPSFERPNGESTRDTMEFNVTGNIVIIRPRASGSEEKPKAGEDEQIPEEMAVCEYCSKVLEENVSKAKCHCGTTYVHDECTSNRLRVEGNNKCKSCGQDFENLPVTLLRRPFDGGDNGQVGKKPSLLSRLKRACLCCHRAIS